MFVVSVEQSFDAAHSLRDYGGKCELMHGHTFKAAVTVKTVKLNNIGLAYDFTVLKKHLGEVLSRFDHHNLNEVAPFDKINPSSENIAITIYNEVKPKLAEGISLESVEVWESPTSHVTYKP
jgi:6-pyruvoyltetrahydropterin/6-carboxytetrahydropterin synthase